MNKETSKFDLWFFQIFHVLLVLIIPLAVVTPTSCIKAPPLKGADLGSEVSSTAVEKAHEEALADIDPYDTRQGEIVRYLTQVKVENGTPQAISAEEQFAKNVCNGPKFVITYDKSIQDLTEDGSEPVVTEDFWEFLALTCDNPPCDPPLPDPCNETLISNSTISHNREPAFKASSVFTQTRAYGLIEKAFSTNHNEDPSLSPFAEREYHRATYHNLKVTNSSKKPPKSVQERENCLGIPKCELRTRLIEYDVALWYSDVGYDKIGVQVEVSPDSPFLGYVTLDCTIQQQFIGDRSYLLRTCKELTDFIY